MQRIATTVLALVGSPAPTELRGLAEALGGSANVRAALPPLDVTPLERAVAAWTEATHAHVPYLVHDADPLADVAAAWIDRWDQAGDVGRLEVAVQAALGRWRARSIELPDYYIVIDAERLAVTARNWYLGVLSGAAPHRVVVTDPVPGDVARAVRRLRAGRWWPELDVLLSGVDRRMPDMLGITDRPTGLVI